MINNYKIHIVIFIIILVYTIVEHLFFQIQLANISNLLGNKYVFCGVSGCYLKWNYKIPFIILQYSIFFIYLKYVIKSSIFMNFFLSILLWLIYIVVTILIEILLFRMGFVSNNNFVVEILNYEIPILPILITIITNFFGVIVIFFLIKRKFLYNKIKQN